MSPLLSAKGGTITTWSAAADFTAVYRQALLNRAASDRSGSSETVFSDARSALDTFTSTHADLQRSLNSLIENVASVAVTSQLKDLTNAFYSDLYRHFVHFRSAPLFYQLSMAFLRRACVAVKRLAIDQLGLFARHLPETTIIAIGPAGRGEYSPSCRLQILIVHEEAAPSQLQTLTLFYHTLHDVFGAVDLPVDSDITPRNPLWAGSLEDWQQRFENGLHPQADEELVHLCRLVDQYPLCSLDLTSNPLQPFSRSALATNRTALTHLVQRMSGLSNGLGIMGRLKLERFGDERGLFRLLDHGLLPFSAALSILALIKESTAINSCDRIRDILKRREMDVNLAERLLTTWHTLQELRLWHEHTSQLSVQNDHTLNLNPYQLTPEQQLSLKEALESVAVIQRSVDNIFSELAS